MSYEERIFGQPYKEKRSLSIINQSAADSGVGSDRFERDPNLEHIEKQLCTGFDTILGKLQENPEDLQARIDRLKNLPDCDGILKKFEPYFTEKHWEMTATLEAYDKATFEHSLRVAAFVYDMASSGETEAYLRERLGVEECSFEELFTASLFHDIGKTAIPCEILHDNHSRREWGRRANDWAIKNTQPLYFDSVNLEVLGDIELDSYFLKLHSMNGFDPLNIVPIEEIFEPEILAELTRHGISSHDTFRKVLEYHEKATRAILRRTKMYVASDIASRHHDYDGKPIRSERYPGGISAVRLGFELSILRSIDVYDALTSKDREYKIAYPPLVALEILIKEAEVEFTDPELTKHVVRDLYKKLVASQENIPKDDTETAALKRILAFIEN